ncbi:SDR family oxidoreductase [Mesorhizobium sp. NBSH29]|uniref:SDR family oxidoreductase n=1 Tax=Mesorhizobium sp. NBSH29 TaxID=2654249 RepID=UPI0018965146|nr:SDR family oxidoreductase [Mesorhizobium sp. NBSH29]QPC87336.1 SDR family oxidoreductase [Mesorhizobium sp. NBSH29]
MAAPIRTALVTGGARRIGRAIVEDLAQNGFAVAIHYHRGAEAAESLANSVRAAGGTAMTAGADLTDRDQMKALLPRVVAELGPVGLLVNSASLFGDDGPTEIDWIQWDRHFGIHLEAPVALANAFVQHLPPSDEGLIVNIIDQRVWRLTPRHFSYTLSKSALWTATQTLAQALAPRIRVNALGPGPTLANERQDQRDFQAQLDGLLLGYGPDLTEFGATIRYLWEARSVTGQMIAIDGGQHLAWETPDVTGMVE